MSSSRAAYPTSRSSSISCLKHTSPLDLSVSLPARTVLAGSPFETLRLDCYCQTDCERCKSPSRWRRRSQIRQCIRQWQPQHGQSFVRRCEDAGRPPPPPPPPPTPPPPPPRRNPPPLLVLYFTLSFLRLPSCFRMFPAGIAACHCGLPSNDPGANSLFPEEPCRGNIPCPPRVQPSLVPPV
jgi:hypothetical protein